MYTRKYCFVKKSNRYWTEAGYIEQLGEHKDQWHPINLGVEGSRTMWPSYSALIITSAC